MIVRALRHLPFVLIVAVLAASIYQHYRQLDPEADSPDVMVCNTATDCARYIVTDFAARDTGNFTARAEGETVVYEYQLDYDRARFEEGGSVFEDGSTVEDYERDMRARACGELYHRDFLRLGGTVVHEYRYSDGEIQHRIVIDRCDERPS